MKFLYKKNAILTILLILFSAHSFSQNTIHYPSKPIRLIIPYAPGGSTSSIGRIYAQKLSEAWGHNILLENIPGGNTIIGSQVLVRAPADGYTLLLITNSHTVNPLLIKNLPYDTIRDFTSVSPISRSEYMLGIHPSVPTNNLKDFINLAKEKPNQLNSATVGTGTVQHLVHELFCNMAGLKIVQIPYKGGGPAMLDLIGGQVQMSFNNLNNLSPHVKIKKVRGLALAGEVRNQALPEMPTFAEAGMPGFLASNWFAVMAPAGTPQEIIQKINTEIKKIHLMSDVKDILNKQGIEPFWLNTQQLDALIRNDLDKYAKIIKISKISITP